MRGLTTTAKLSEESALNLERANAAAARSDYGLGLTGAIDDQLAAEKLKADRAGMPAFGRKPNMFAGADLMKDGILAERLKNDRTLGLPAKGRKDFKAEFLSGDSLSRKIQTAALEKDKNKTPMEQLDEAKKTNKLLEDMKGAGLQGKKTIAAFS